MANDDERLATHFHLLSGVGQHTDAGTPQPPPDQYRLTAPIVVAENAKSGHTPTETAQDRHKPPMMVITVYQVSGDRDEIGFPGGAQVHDVLEKNSIGSPAKMGKKRGRS
jgi:hypothetical protein